MQTTTAPELKGVFFDLYGTLLILGDMKQAWSDWMEVLYGALCSRNTSLTRDSFDDCCHQFFGKEEPIAQTEDGLTIFERRLLRLAANLGSEIEMSVLKETATRAVNAWQTHVRLDPEAIGVLTALKKSKILALISNFDHPPHARRVLTEVGLDRCFETIVISGEIGIKKPDPRIFRMALEATGLRPDQIVYVGDTQEDVDGAIAAGIRPFLIARSAEANQPGILDYTRKDEQSSARRLMTNPTVAVATIASLPEILGLLENLHTTNVQ
jgi:putative hydrolase of the HAD superfamily